MIERMISKAAQEEAAKQNGVWCPASYTPLTHGDGYGSFRHARAGEPQPCLVEISLLKNKKSARRIHGRAVARVIDNDGVIAEVWRDRVSVCG